VLKQHLDQLLPLLARAVVVVLPGAILGLLSLAVAQVVVLGSLAKASAKGCLAAAHVDRPEAAEPSVVALRLLHLREELEPRHQRREEAVHSSCVGIAAAASVLGKAAAYEYAEVAQHVVVVQSSAHAHCRRQLQTEYSLDALPLGSAANNAKATRVGSHPDIPGRQQPRPRAG